MEHGGITWQQCAAGKRYIYILLLFQFLTAIVKYVVAFWYSHIMMHDSHDALCHVLAHTLEVCALSSLDLV